MNTLLEILTYLVFSAIIFSIIWYIVYNTSNTNVNCI